MKNIKIAFFFGGNGYSSNFNSLKTKLNHDGFSLDIRYIKTLYSLLKFAPEILITHESCDLNNYLLLSPNNLKWLNIMSAGVDKTLAFLKLNNIPPEYLITSTKGIHKNAISEYVIASILYFEKNINKRSVFLYLVDWRRNAREALAEICPKFCVGRVLYCCPPLRRRGTTTVVEDFIF